MLDTEKKREIQQKALEVTRISEKFQLSHAAYACQNMIRDSIIRYYKDKYTDLSKRMKEKMLKGLNYDNEQKEKTKLEMLIRQKHFHIDVEYIESPYLDVARVIKVDNSFVINLSRELERNIFKEDGSYNYEIIQKIRHLMAHELGHLLLHTDEILNIEGTQGSKLIKDDDKEDEADCFGKHLLELRKERNEQISRDGGAQNLF